MSLAGLALIAKSVTETLVPAVAVKLLPGTEICALLPTSPPTVGVVWMITVAVAPELSAPILQVMVLFTGVVPQLLEDGPDAETKVAPAARKSVKVMPLV